jgi:hypothetical protein
VEGGCKGKGEGRPRVGKRGGWRPRKGKNRGATTRVLWEKETTPQMSLDFASNGPQLFPHIHAPKINLWQHFFGILQSSCLQGSRRLLTSPSRTARRLPRRLSRRRSTARVAPKPYRPWAAFFRAFGLDDVPSGSSPQSHLQALGGHVRSRLRGALHHGVRRAFAVLASHYDVDLERVSEGYCLPDEEEAALAEVQRLDAAVEGPRAALASSFEVKILSPVSPSKAGPDSAEGGNDAEGAAPPPTDT